MSHNWSVYNYMHKTETVKLYEELICKTLIKLTKKIDKKIIVVMAHIPKIKKDNRYPVLVKEEKCTYIYLYFVEVSTNYSLDKRFHFAENPKHVFTFSLTDQKNNLYNKISELKKEIEVNSTFGVIPYDLDKNIFPSANDIIRPLMTDQDVDFEDYISSMFTETKTQKVEEHPINKILETQDRDQRITILRDFISDFLNSDKKKDKKWLPYENVDYILDYEVKNIVKTYNNLIKYLQQADIFEQCQTKK
jgi:hypothetical protein